MIPASIRNNNPGAMYPGPSAKKFGGDKYETLKSKDGTHKIATFATPLHGAAAMFDLLANGKPIVGAYRYRDQTLRDAIKTWCGEYHLDSYIAMVTEHCDLKANDKLTMDVLSDPRDAIPLAKAMAQQEAGQAFPLTDEQWKQAHAMAFPVAAVPAWTPTNSTPTRNPEDKADAAFGLALRVAGGVVAAGTTAKVGSDAVSAPAKVDAAHTALTDLDAYAAAGQKLLAMATLPNLMTIGIGAAFFLITQWLLPKVGIGAKK